MGSIKTQKQSSPISNKAKQSSVRAGKPHDVTGAVDKLQVWFVDASTPAADRSPAVV